LGVPLTPAEEEPEENRGGNIRVCVRVRPLNEREKKKGEEKGEALPTYRNWVRWGLCEMLRRLLV
jgi:hypothetical protein